MRCSLHSLLALLAVGLASASAGAQTIRPCPKAPLQGGWFYIGDRCRKPDGRICTLISVNGDRTGNWSCTSGKGKG